MYKIGGKGMTAKEALHKLTRCVVVSNVDERIQGLLTEDSKYPIMQTEEYNVIKQALTELEELKRDVKRYFELMNSDDWTGGEVESLYDEILSKVGKEE